jgi:hypothetical protein
MFSSQNDALVIYSKKNKNLRPITKLTRKVRTIKYLKLHQVLLKIYFKVQSNSVDTHAV